MILLSLTHIRVFEDFVDRGIIQEVMMTLQVDTFLLSFRFKFFQVIFRGRFLGHRLRRRVRILCRFRVVHWASDNKLLRLRLFIRLWRQVLRLRVESSADKVLLYFILLGNVLSATIQLWITWWRSQWTLILTLQMYSNIIILVLSCVSSCWPLSIINILFDLSPRIYDSYDLRFLDRVTTS